jgi:hypothetical protein
MPVSDRKSNDLLNLRRSRPEGRARTSCKASPPKAKRKTTMMVAEAPRRAPRCKARLLADAQHLHHKDDTHMWQVEGEHSKEAPPGSSGCRHHSRCDMGTAPPHNPSRSLTHAKVFTESSLQLMYDNVLLETSTTANSWQCLFRYSQIMAMSFSLQPPYGSLSTGNHFV